MDSEAEALMQDASASFMVGRTTMIITHRLSSLHYAVRIFILEDGHISQEGSYGEIVAWKRYLPASIRPTGS